MTGCTPTDFAASMILMLPSIAQADAARIGRRKNLISDMLFHGLRGRIEESEKKKRLRVNSSDGSIGPFFQVIHLLEVCGFTSIVVFKSKESTRNLGISHFLVCR